MTLKFNGWPSKTIGHLFYATSSFVHHFVAIGEFKLELESGNAQSGSNSTLFRAVWPWNLTDDLTFKNNRAPLPSIIKLYASFHHHMWIQTGVTVRERLSWVLTSVTLTLDLWPWPYVWASLLLLAITPENFMMIRWWEHGEKGLTDGQTDGQTDGLNQSYSCLGAAKNMYAKQSYRDRSLFNIYFLGFALHNCKHLKGRYGINDCVWRWQSGYKINSTWDNNFV